MSQYLTFELAGEELAFPILAVREIIEYGYVTRVPQMPESIRGVINLRGNVVPVVDLAVRFELPARQIDKRTCIVIVEVDNAGEQLVIGVIADAVSEVIELAQGHVQPPPLFGTAITPEYVLGMAPLGERFALILDVARLLSVEELLRSQKARALAPQGLADLAAREAE